MQRSEDYVQAAAHVQLNTYLLRACTKSRRPPQSETTLHCLQQQPDGGVCQARDFGHLIAPDCQTQPQALLYIGFP